MGQHRRNTQLTGRSLWTLLVRAQGQLVHLWRRYEVEPRGRGLDIRHKDLDKTAAYQYGKDADGHCWSSLRLPHKQQPNATGGLWWDDQGRSDDAGAALLRYREPPMVPG